jgi:hypothetical protein
VSPRDAILVINRLIADSDATENEPESEPVEARPLSNLKLDASIVDVAFAIRLDADEHLESLKPQIARIR